MTLPGDYWRDKTDDQLAEEAQAGLRGQAAIVEAMRRLRASIDDLSESSNRYSQTIIRLTWALIGLTVVLAILALPPAISTVFKD